MVWYGWYGMVWYGMDGWYGWYEWYEWYGWMDEQTGKALEAFCTSRVNELLRSRRF